MTVLAVSDLRKEFVVRGSARPLVAVGGISFSISRGETLGLVGESGSGKTTVGRIIMGLEEQSSGEVTFQGQSIKRLVGDGRAKMARELQMVFQDPADSLNPRFRIGDIVSEPLKVLGTDRLSRRQMASDALWRVGLARDTFYNYPHQLPAGAQQKVALARAIVARPGMLVLDEPTSALDVKSRHELLVLLREIQSDSGMSTLFISHDLTAVASLADKIAVMYLGRIVEYGTTQQVFRNPGHPYTQALLASVPIPDPERDRPVRLRVAGEIPSPMNIPSGCSLRARCPLATNYCATIDPTLKKIGNGQLVACVRAGD